MTQLTPLVTSPTLQSVLAAADLARTQSLAILDLLDAHHASSTTDSDSDSQQLALSTQQKKLTAYLAQLRGLNRKAVLGVRSTKQETGEARQEIDALHLQLQNLYYEQRHLRGEIAGCEDYEYVVLFFLASRA
jgi:THO complex subunit 5